MTRFSSPVRAFLLLALTVLGQSSALAHVCVWSMGDNKSEVRILSESAPEATVDSPCHDRSDGDRSDGDSARFTALDSAPPDVAHLCMCATGGCATAAAMPAHSVKPETSIGSLGYPELIEHTLNPPLMTPLRPPSFA